MRACLLLLCLLLAGCSTAGSLYEAYDNNYKRTVAVGSSSEKGAYVEYRILSR